MSDLRKTVNIGGQEFILQTLKLRQMRENMREMANITAMPDGAEKEDAMIARFTKTILLCMNNVEGAPTTSEDGLDSMLNCGRNGVEAMNAFYSLHGEAMAVSGMKMADGAAAGEAGAAPETSTSTNSAVA